METTLPPSVKDADETIQVEYNTWLANVKKDMAKYPDSLQVQAANHLYVHTFEQIEAKMLAAKATVTIAEKTFNQMLFKVIK
jgi:hypothetical protein